jgi:flagellar basal body-associated protein FliL
MSEKEPALTEADAIPAAEGDKPAKAHSSLGGLIAVVAGLLVMVLTPMISYFVVKATVPPPIEPVAEHKEGENKDVVLPLKAITVNIAETKGTRILRLEPHLVLSEAKLLEELKSSTAMLADKIILAVGRKTIDELEGPDGRQGLKRDIMSEINAAFRGRMAGSVIDVYFNEFLIQ